MKTIYLVGVRCLQNYLNKFEFSMKSVWRDIERHPNLWLEHYYSIVNIVFRAQDPKLPQVCAGDDLWTFNTLNL